MEIYYISNKLVFFQNSGVTLPDWEDLKWNQHAGAPGFTLFPLLPRRPQMHWPRQGCTSLGRTERLLCSGSWSPDALIETLRPCRNQREGNGEQGRGCEHIWHLQTPAHTLIWSWEKCKGHVENCQLYFTSAEDIQAHTHIQLCDYYFYNLEK